MSQPSILLRRGALSPGTGSPYQAQPGNAAEITIWDSGANVAAPWPGASRYARLELNINSSHDSAADGVLIEVSSDGENWDTYKSYTYATLDGTVTYDIKVDFPHMRIKYTNSAADLTRWRMSLMGIRKDRAIA